MTTEEQLPGLRGASICAHRRVRSRCIDCKRCKAELTRRTTRRAQVPEAHAVVVGALLSALARLINWRCLQMRLAAGLACIHRVSFRAHTISRTLQRTRAHAVTSMCSSASATSHTHTAPLLSIPRDKKRPSKQPLMVRTKTRPSKQPLMVRTFLKVYVGTSGVDGAAMNPLGILSRG